MTPLSTIGKRDLTAGAPSSNNPSAIWPAIQAASTDRGINWGGLKGLGEAGVQELLEAVAHWELYKDVNDFIGLALLQQASDTIFESISYSLYDLGDDQANLKGPNEKACLKISLNGYLDFCLARNQGASPVATAYFWLERNGTSGKVSIKRVSEAEKQAIDASLAKDFSARKINYLGGYELGLGDPN